MTDAASERKKWRGDETAEERERYVADGLLNGVLNSMAEEAEISHTKRLSHYIADYLAFMQACDLRQKVQRAQTEGRKMNQPGLGTAELS